MMTSNRSITPRPGPKNPFARNIGGKLNGSGTVNGPAKDLAGKLAGAFNKAPRGTARPTVIKANSGDRTFVNKRVGSKLPPMSQMRR